MSDAAGVLIRLRLHGSDSRMLNVIGTIEVGESLPQIDGIVLECSTGDLGKDRFTERLQSGRDLADDAEKMGRFILFCIMWKELNKVWVKHIIRMAPCTWK